MHSLSQIYTSHKTDECDESFNHINPMSQETDKPTPSVSPNDSLKLSSVTNNSHREHHNLENTQDNTSTVNASSNNPDNQSLDDTFIQPNQFTIMNNYEKDSDTDSDSAYLSNSDTDSGDSVDSNTSDDIDEEIISEID